MKPITLASGEEFRNYVYNGKPTIYFVSNEGKVYNAKKKIFLKQETTKVGYKRVTLNLPVSDKKNKKYHMSVHRLVALLFVPNDDPEHKDQVDHLDCDKSNNSSTNLEWVTGKANVIRAVDNDIRGTKITKEEAERICQLLEPGNLTFREISDIVDCDVNIIASINSGKAWTRISSKYNIKKRRKYSKPLDETTVHAICKLLENGMRNTEVAKKMNCSVHIIDSIRMKHSWRHISDQYNIKSLRTRMCLYKPIDDLLLKGIKPTNILDFLDISENDKKNLKWLVYKRRKVLINKGLLPDN